MDAGLGTSYVTTEVRDSLYAGFEPGTLTPTEHASFMQEVLEYLGVVPE